MVDLARKNLLHDKLRFAITISGVAFAVTLVLVQIGLFLGLLENFERWGLPWKVVQGNVSDLRRGAYVFLDASAAKRFGPFELGDYREFAGSRLKIIGVTKEARSFTTTPLSFMDFDLAQRVFTNLSNRASYILVKLAPGADPEAVRAEIRRRLPFNDVFTRREWASRSRNYWVISTGLGLNMFITVFLGC